MRKQVKNFEEMERAYGDLNEKERELLGYFEEVHALRVEVSLGYMPYYGGKPNWVREFGVIKEQTVIDIDVKILAEEFSVWDTREGMNEKKILKALDKIYETGLLSSFEEISHPIYSIKLAFKERWCR